MSNGRTVYIAWMGLCGMRGGEMYDPGSDTGRAMLRMGAELKIVEKKGEQPLPYTTAFNESSGGFCRQYLYTTAAGLQRRARPRVKREGPGVGSE